MNFVCEAYCFTSLGLAKGILASKSSLNSRGIEFTWFKKSRFTSYSVVALFWSTVPGLSSL